MSESGGPVFEGVGRPDTKPISGAKDRLNQWAKRTFTMDGREQVQREKILQNFDKVTQNLTPEQKTAAVDILNKNIDKQSHDAAVKSIVRDAVLTTIGVAGAGLGIIKRESIVTFARNKVPGFLKTERFLRTKKYLLDYKISGLPFVKKVGEIVNKITRKKTPIVGLLSSTVRQ